jgi:enoyl-CoA hydratase
VFELAIELARIIASNAPFGVRAALASARAAERVARDAARAVVFELNAAVAGSADAAEGMMAFVERRPAVFQGR